MLSPTGELLLRQLADGRFHSGEQLATALGLSRSAIWKQIHKLQTLGLDIQAVSGRGYRLAQPLERLDEEAILTALDPELPRPRIEIHTCLPSTNTYLLHQMAEDGGASVCLAETQTAGKGRLGRRWVSPFGCNIYLSLSWRFADASLSAGLSLAVGVAIVRALSGMGFPQLALKWPNDVLWQGRKLAGVLIEAVSEYQGGCKVVVGVGLNLWLPAKAAQAIDQPWVDAYTILGRIPPRNLTVARLLNHLLPLLIHYERGGLEPWLGEWRRWNCVLGRPVRVVQGKEQFDATAVDVTREGLLRLIDLQGRERLLAAGDVKLRLQGDGHGTADRQR